MRAQHTTPDAGTPSSRWAAEGKVDPHGNSYDGERALLAHGNLTDDELANAVFMCDHRSSFESIGWLTAAKDRIRWLSRRLSAAVASIANLEAQRQTDATDAARWRAFRDRDYFSDLSFSDFQDQFREDADDVIDEAIVQGRTT